MQLSIYAGDNTSVLLLEGLENRQGAAVNNATVTAELLNSAGVAVFEGALSYVSGSDGDYEAEFTPDPALTHGQRLTGTISATQGAKKYTVDLSVTAQLRS